MSEIVFKKLSPDLEDINNKNQIVGTTQSITARGFIYQNGTYTYIDEPSSVPANPHAGQGTGTFLFQINDVGSLAGTYADPNVRFHGFIYKGGVYSTIDVPGAARTDVYGLNNSNSVVGAYTDAAGVRHGFLDQNNVFTPIDFPGAITSSYPFNGTLATGISDSGDIVGNFYSGSTQSSVHGFKLSAGQFTQIDDPLGVNGTTITGINNLGHLVGNYVDAAGHSHGFVMAGSTFTTIDDDRLAAKGQSLSLSGINDADTVVGGDSVVTVALGATPDVAFGFAFGSASVHTVGPEVIIDGSDGTHAQVTGATTYRFSDGMIREHAGSPLVDDLYYDVANKDVYAAGLDPTTHYNQQGWHEGRNPNAFFSTTGYLGANPDVAAAAINPLQHYDQYGWKEGRDPSASFDDELYLRNNPDVAKAGIDPLSHYLNYGQAEGRQAYAAIGPAASFNHGSFDAEYYLLSNPDVAKAALASGATTVAAADAFAYTHYETYGWHEGRNPNAYFDVNGYLNAYTDVKLANIDPLAHYDQYGWHEGRDPSGAFDTKQYEAHYADVAAAGIDPLQHYLQYGALEGRSAFSDGHFS